MDMQSMRRKYIESALQDLELAISATPTSELREKLTEANIHLMEAERINREKNNG